MSKSLNLLHSEVITKATDIVDVLEILLKNRQVKDVSTFLKPPYPEIKLALAPALKVIRQAIDQKQNILIYGDYDVDGITATAILWQALYKLTPNVTPFIPHREHDGYGIKADSFFRFQKEKGINFDLLITVDNGIVASKELVKIKAKQKVKIIVTDHHLPDGRGVIDHAHDSLVHSTKISGSAVSWFMAHELDKQADLGLAALGTVADCLPLTDVNRSIVVHGLQSLRVNPSPGIKKLIQISGIKGDNLSTYELAFILAPRINAIGRLSDPTDALRLLCSQNPLQAAKYASTLNSFNQDRQVLQKESLDHAEALISEKLKADKLIFLSGDYNPGIIGLIAGRLTEKYYLPSVVISTENDLAKGSCRSIPELNIIEALREHQNLFVDLGGHPGAAGFSAKIGNIPKLKKVLTKSVNLKLNQIKLEPHLDVDAVMDLNAVNLKIIKAISELAPFGIGNPEPLFLFKDIVIKSKKLLGASGDHLKLQLACPPSYEVAGVAFKKGNLHDHLNIGQTISFVASLSINEWNHLQIPQLIIKEIL